MGGYDGHIIFQNICKIESIAEPQVVAKSMEKFVTFSIGSLKFKDSFQFLNSPLDKLVTNLAGKVKNGKRVQDIFKNTWQYFQNKSLDLGGVKGSKISTLEEDRMAAFEMLTRKGVYPYSYMDSFERFEETELPPREAFFNDLSKEGVSDEEYEFVHQIWKKFHLKNMGELHDLYM